MSNVVSKTKVDIVFRIASLNLATEKTEKNRVNGKIG